MSDSTLHPIRPRLPLYENPLEPRPSMAPNWALACRMSRGELNQELLRYAGACMRSHRSEYAADAAHLAALAAESLLRPTNCPASERHALPYMKCIVRVLARRAAQRNRFTPLSDGLLGNEVSLNSWDEAHAIQAARDVHEAVATLPAQMRSVCELYWLEGYTAPQIAAKKGLALSTIKNEIARARIRLKTALTRYDPQTSGNHPHRRSDADETNEM